MEVYAQHREMVTITPSIILDEDELIWSFVRASGPGGQNVNKVSTAVELRFDLRQSPSLPEAVKRRAEVLASRWLTQDGVIVIFAQTTRTQERNREEALKRLVEMLQQAAVVQKPRRPTKPTLGSRKRRLESKNKRGDVKAMRGRIRDGE